MGVLGSALKATYLHLGGTGGYAVPPTRDVVYQSPWDDAPTSVIGSKMTTTTALSYPPYFAGVRLIAESVARLPHLVYRRVGEDNRTRARGTRLYEMLHDQPNPAMSAMVWREAMQGHLINWGSCYSEIIYDELGRATELWPLRPDRMTVLFDTDRREKVYQYRIETLGDVVTLPARRVFHIPSFGSDGFVGYSLVTLFREALALGLAAQEFGVRFFKSGAQPAAVVTHPKGWRPEDQERFAKTLRSNHAGLTNAQRIAVLEEGVTWQAVGMNLDDAQFLETRKHQRGEVATMLNVPPHMIGDVERSTSWGTGIEEQTLGFVTFSLGAWLGRWQQESDRQLVVPAYGRNHYSEFEVNALLKGRAEDRMKFYQGLWQMGVINADTIARKENLPAPADGSGSTYYVPMNYGPAGLPEEEPAQPLNGNGSQGPLGEFVTIAEKG